MNARETKLKSLSVLKSVQEKGRLQMEIEVVGIFGFALIAIAFTKMGVERRLDVLHGPYLKSTQERSPGISLKRRWRSAHTGLDRLRLMENMRQDQLASIAC